MTTTGSDHSPGTFDLRVEHELPATPEVVFDTYTDADKQIAWLTMDDEEPGFMEMDVDLRVGGIQDAAWGPSVDQIYHEKQEFLEIDRPHRLVTTSRSTFADGTTSLTRIEMTFDAVGDGHTRVRVEQTGFDDEETRDAFRDAGWPDAFDALERYLIRESES